MKHYNPYKVIKCEIAFLVSNIYLTNGKSLSGTSITSLMLAHWPNLDSVKHL